MNRTMIVFVTMLVAITAIVIGFREDPVQAVETKPGQVAQDSSQDLMQWKLEQAKVLLEALALEDYERLGLASGRLIEISMRAQWTQPHSERFGLYGDEFRRSLTRMGENALEKDLDGVTLNFLQMVATCVECHVVVRETESIASLDTTEITPLQNLLKRN